MSEIEPSRPDARHDSLRRCPDCEGLLERSEPAWTAAVDIAADTCRPPETAHWRCPLCGYRE